MVVLAILGLGITALLETISWGIWYARDTENNIKAINIAREGIEGMTNIRDTNWLRFSSDKVNCWKVKDYSSACIGTALPSYTIPSIPAHIWPQSYTIFTTNGIWFLSWATTILPTSWTTYKNQYQVGLDSEGFYSQTGVSSVTCSSVLQSSCKTIFTREINIANVWTSTGAIVAKSIVRWYDKRPQSVILETTLTNWKSNF
jgi:hypothetical protein